MKGSSKDSCRETLGSAESAVNILSCKLYVNCMKAVDNAVHILSGRGQIGTQGHWIGNSGGANFLLVGYVDRA